MGCGSSSAKAPNSSDKAPTAAPVEEAEPAAEAAPAAEVKPAEGAKAAEADVAKCPATMGRPHQFENGKCKKCDAPEPEGAAAPEASEPAKAEAEEPKPAEPAADAPKPDEAKTDAAEPEPAADAAAAAEAPRKLTQEEFQELVELFGVYDKDNSGRIDATELTNLMLQLGGGELLSREEVLDMIQVAVMDDDGKINFEEFTTVMTQS